MNNENTENETPINEENEVSQNPSEESGETPNNEPEVDIDELKRKAELADNYKIRAEKAESKLKKDKPVKQEQTTRLSDDDLLYLSRTQIHSDDLSDVRTHAEKYGVSVKEAHTFLTPILEKRENERQAAAATNTARSPRGTNKIDGQDLLSRAHRGELPTESDDAAISALVKAEYDAKRASAKVTPGS